MDQLESKYQKCIDENGREYLLRHSEKNNMDIKLYFTGQENPQTLIMLKEAFASQIQAELTLNT